MSTKDIILNENNEEETFNEINYETDPLYGTLKSSQQAATSELTANTNNYTYNDFRDKLKQVELKVSGVPYGKNTLKYDENGRLCEASPSENCVYGFKYDKFGKAVEFSLNGVILLTKDYDYDKNSVSASYYRSETEIDILKTKYDKYGRIKKLYNNDNLLLETNYEDETSDNFVESPSCANMTTMKDRCTEKEYTYVYDKYTGRPIEYSVQNSEMRLKVFSSGSNKIKYEFDEGFLDYEDEITYDDKCLISPRITKAYNNSDWGMNWNLSYDSLGRYSGREEDFNFMFGACPKMTISYKRGTCLKEQIEYEKAYKETITQEYDSRGNIISIEDTNNFSYFSGTNKS